MTLLFHKIQFVGSFHSNKLTDIGNKSIGMETVMEIKANVKIAIRHFVLILKKLRLKSALRYDSDNGCRVVAVGS